METLSLILRCAPALLGFVLLHCFWEVNRFVSSVVIGFMSFGILFCVVTVMVSALYQFSLPDGLAHFSFR